MYAGDILRALESGIDYAEQRRFAERGERVRRLFHVDYDAFFVRGVAGEHTEKERNPASVGNHVQHEALQVGSAVLGVAERDLLFDSFARNVLAVHAEFRRVGVKIERSMEKGGEEFYDETFVESGDAVFTQVVEKPSYGVVVQMPWIHVRPDQPLRREVLEELVEKVETALDEGRHDSVVGQ